MGNPTSQKIAQVYDKFEEFIVASLTPDHVELRDNLFIENNSDLDLAEGYCLRWTGATNPKITIDCPLYVAQEVIVTLTQKNFGTDEDRKARKEAEKKILGHRDDIFKIAYNDSDLEGVAITTDREGDNGIQDIVSENGLKYLMIEVRFIIQYKDKL